LLSDPAQSLPMNERNSIRDRSLIQGHLEIDLVGREIQEIRRSWKRSRPRLSLER
jgi:hypothetical protein